MLALIPVLFIFCVFILVVGIFEYNFTIIGIALFALMCLLFVFQIIRHDEHPQHYLIRVFEHGIEIPSRNLMAAFEGKTEYFSFAAIEEMRYESYLEPLCFRLMSGETLFVENGHLGMNVRKSDIVEQWKKYRTRQIDGQFY